MDLPKFAQPLRWSWMDPVFAQSGGKCCAVLQVQPLSHQNTPNVKYICSKIEVTTNFDLGPGHACVFSCKHLWDMCSCSVYSSGCIMLSRKCTLQKTTSKPEKMAQVWSEAGTENNRDPQQMQVVRGWFLSNLAGKQGRHMTVSCEHSSITSQLLLYSICLLSVERILTFWERIV